MNKVVKDVIAGLLIVLVIAGAFIAGDFINPNIISSPKNVSEPQIAEPIPKTEPFTADEIVDVEVVEPIDDSGSGEVEIVQQKVPYVVQVNFQPVLLREAQLEKKLLIMTQRATAPQTAKKDGLLNIPVFKQSKVIIFHGEGSYYVDLSSLSSSDFEIDDDKKNITINIPKPQLSVKLLSEETEFFDSSNGMLRVGEMEITPEVMTTLETQGIARITEILEADANAWDTAVRYAKLSVKEIYEPLITAQVDKAVEDAADEYAIPAYYTITVNVKD